MPVVILLETSRTKRIKAAAIEYGGAVAMMSIAGRTIIRNGTRWRIPPCRNGVKKKIIQVLVEMFTIYIVRRSAT